MKLTGETKRRIIESRLVLVGSGVPPEALARMDAGYAIDLLENQRPDWYEPKQGPLPLTPELEKVFNILDQLIADKTVNAHLVTEDDLYSAYKAYKAAK